MDALVFKTMVGRKSQVGSIPMRSRQFICLRSGELMARDPIQSPLDVFRTTQEARSRMPPPNEEFLAERYANEATQAAVLAVVLAFIPLLPALICAYAGARAIRHAQSFDQRIKGHVAEFAALLVLLGQVALPIFVVLHGAWR